MISVIPQPEQGTNPVCLIDKIVWFNQATDTYLRIAVCAADNKPTPYFLIQIFQTPTPDKYILNYALYPNQDVINEITTGLLTSIDFIVAALRMAAKQGKVFNVENGEEYLDALYGQLDILDRLFASTIDMALLH